MLSYQGIDTGPLFDWWQLIMNNHDAPTHTRLRSLVGRAFTPRQVQLVRQRIHSLAHELADSLGAAAEADLVPTFCNNLQLIVLCDMLGVPPSDYRIVERWTTLVGLFERCEITPTIDDPAWVPFAAARRYESLPCTITPRS